MSTMSFNKMSYWKNADGADPVFGSQENAARVLLEKKCLLLGYDVIMKIYFT